MRVTAQLVRKALLGSFLLAPLGCDVGTEVKLADVPQQQLPPTKKLEELPKKVRAKAGSTAGLQFDSSGVVRPKAEKAE